MARKPVGQPEVKQARNNLWASRARLEKLRGEYVIEAVAGSQQEIYLLRRLDILEMLEADHWPRPITAEIRRVMAVGSVNAASEAGRWSKYVEACRHLIIAAAIIPPEELVAGDITVAEITRDMCRPLFVDVGDPVDDDQLVLVSNKAYDDLEVEIEQLRCDPEKADELAAAEAKFSQWFTFTAFDFAGLASTITATVPGGLSRFRPAGRQPNDDVGSVADPASDERENQPTT